MPLVNLCKIGENWRIKLMWTMPHQNYRCYKIKFTFTKMFPTSSLYFDHIRKRGVNDDATKLREAIVLACGN